ncbi:hypothetical protein BDZ89DRAFT_417894 [Hymenopellis radicata]|nr:hypothetical protein BDZ89DRAFT_417894 [Hymenopellis radicata]
MKTEGPTFTMTAGQLTCERNIEDVNASMNDPCLVAIDKYLTALECFKLCWTTVYVPSSSDPSHIDLLARAARFLTSRRRCCMTRSIAEFNVLCVTVPLSDVRVRGNSLEIMALLHPRMSNTAVLAELLRRMPNVLWSVRSIRLQKSSSYFSFHFHYLSFLVGRLPRKQSR